MLLRLTLPAADWVRLAAALEAADSLILAGVVRAVLASSLPTTTIQAVSLLFTPAQTGELQRTATTLGLSLLATPVAEAPDAGGWVTSAAERAEAVAAADAIVRAHQRRRIA